jgi:hypothetical protein
LKFLEELFLPSEERFGLVCAHFQNIGDRFVSVLDVEDVGLEAFSTALTARELDIGHELHIDEGKAESFASLAAPAGTMDWNPFSSIWEQRQSPESALESENRKAPSIITSSADSAKRNFPCFRSL